MPFDCSDTDLNDFLLNDAKNYLRKLLSVTYIIEYENKTIAFFSVSNDKISYEEKSISNRSFKKLFQDIMPEGKKYKSYPAVRVGYKPSKLFLHVYKPINETEREEALIDCLLNPDLYKRLLLQFQHGIVPSVSALSTILFRNHNIAEAASENAAQIFIDNLKYLKLLDDNNYLLLNRQIDVETVEKESGSTKEENKKPNIKLNDTLSKKPDNSNTKKHDESSREQIDSYPIIIPLKNSRVGKLILPVDFNDEDLDKVEKFIDALRN